MKRVCLLTGPPRAGKTTLIKQVVGEFQGKTGGFYTEEIREREERVGFRLVTLDGAEVVLSHTNIQSPYRVGKYGVDIEGLEEVGVTALLEAGRTAGLIVVDEIGKMEMLSLKFREAVTQLIGGGKRMLGTVLLHHHAWSDVLKARPEVMLVMLNRENYGQVLDEVRRWLKETA
ncbi:MAG: nucleoside-triphosphatase [Dehalococcoidia bacterium]|nr:nucleoside-triphosphatase [Dehalococcoidia bacterium]